MSAKIKKGDTVEIICGKEEYQGMRGTVHKIIPRKNQVIVAGANIIKKHQRPTRTRTQTGIIEREAPIHISNVALVCPRCDQRTKVGFRLFEDGKVRVCKRCGEAID